MWILLLLLTSVKARILNSRIVGGESTTIDKYPYQVSIHYHDELYCGGSIINERWILTAAHCVYEKEPKYFAIRIGSSYHNQGGQLIRNITKIISHDRYDDDELQHDVAVIKLASAIVLNTNSMTIPLARPEATIEVGSESVATGWGQTSSRSEVSDILRVVTLSILENHVCEKVYSCRKFTSGMLCVGDLNGRKDTCKGDSGGPLVYNGVQIGIVSWGVGCADGYPGVYTRVSDVRSWIMNNTQV